MKTEGWLGLLATNRALGSGDLICRDRVVHAASSCGLCTHIHTLTRKWGAAEQQHPKFFSCLHTWAYTQTYTHPARGWELTKHSCMSVPPESASKRGCRGALHTVTIGAPDTRPSRLLSRTNPVLLASSQEDFERMSPAYL